MWIKPFITLILLAPPALAGSLCSMSNLSVEPASTQARYDVFASGAYTLISTYRLRANIEGEQCQIPVKLEIDDGDSFLKGEANAQLIFEWQGGNGYQKGNQWHVVLTENNADITFQIRYPAQQWLASGIYQGKLEATVLTEQLLNNEYVLPAVTNIAVTVLPMAKIQFYGLTQQHYELDMGILQSNKVVTSAPKLWIQSNAGYNLVFESTNRGALRHKSADTQWDISYDMYLDSKQINLDQASARVSENTPSKGHAKNMKFIIGDTLNKPGGTYNDVLQISIEPKLSQQP
ncbi:conserved exported hypothetical protein [Vibrio harveyi]|jgi:hypothetical protein|uniref:hypothetical protein n=1 Tax=Vibrio TaxID=662 RepID=UPI00028BF50B|nr:MULTISPECIES: hypothetical protein [Vibrio]APP04414.1 hypothetical protein BG259_03100 [Vibrio harveyi]EKM19130.1 hypothetical protein VCHENC01_4945 [Vibrio harveyi]EKO3786274.1 hypothetical protein [Vibrio harveyi]EKO3801070.1 hypothetical protein [Vibrio harveyi]EKO3839494.1 hypothetical protein [Vibrio harveyi]